MDISGWVDPNTHGWVLSPRTDGEWESLAADYGGVAPAPLARVIACIREHGCRTVIVENRYVDRDYRSEYSEFWSKRFEGVPAFARRLHFFSSEIKEADLHQLPPDVGYLGYCVVKPLASGSVGRTMIAPPPSLAQATLATARDEVTLFGNPLVVEAAPFCQQDGEFFRCAHAAAWMCHYSAARRDLVAVQHTARFPAATPTMLSAERALPSKGMSLLQLQAVFGAFGQPALFYGLGRMPRVEGVDDPLPVEGVPPGKWDTRLFSVICRYLNSGYPVLISTKDHAFVIVGWYREGEWIRFIANDDQRGPYDVINSPFDDERGVWQAIMVPLPPKVLLSGEAAETKARHTLRGLGASQDAPPAWAAIAAGVADKSLSVRTVLRDASAYKAALSARGIEPGVIQLIRLARLPHFVWVVEVHNRDARDDRKPCVLAEVVFDATSSDFAPRLDALLMPTLAMTYPPDAGTPVPVRHEMDVWESTLPLSVGQVPIDLQAAG